MSQCPLFQDARHRASGPGGHGAAADEPWGPPPRLKGLCVNCEHRLTCAHARRTGGVWHCENYE